MWSKPPARVVYVERQGDNYATTDPLTGADLGEVGRRDAEKVRVNNNLRRVIRSAVGQLTLLSDNPATRPRCGSIDHARRRSGQPAAT
jgi:urea transport system permease protein